MKTLPLRPSFHIPNRVVTPDMTLEEIIARLAEIEARADEPAGSDVWDEIRLTDPEHTHARH